jgi:type III pantothenate kinase
MRLMLLAIDCGNTQTVIGLYELDDDAPPGGAADAGLVEHWRIGTIRDRTADELAVTLQGFLRFAGFSNDDDVEGIAISSGVPRVTAALREMSQRAFDLEPVVIEPGTKTGIAVLYDNPKEVGADRIANAVAAHDLYEGCTIMVDFGTATTCDAVSANGEYLGGAIVPGIEISLDALFARAAALRQVELKPPRSVLGKSTVESIQSGTIFGYTSLVDGLCRRIADELGDDCNVVATGGLADLIAPLSSMIQHREPWLTLHGLRLVYLKNV